MQREVKINTEYISLSNLLQLADIVGSGGQAKLIIQDKLVQVNDEWCTQRGKKIYPGDHVQVFLEPETEITVKKSN